MLKLIITPLYLEFYTIHLTSSSIFDIRTFAIVEPIFKKVQVSVKANNKALAEKDCCRKATIIISTLYANYQHDPFCKAFAEYCTRVQVLGVLRK